MTTDERELWDLWLQQYPYPPEPDHARRKAFADAVAVLKSPERLLDETEIIIIIERLEWMLSQAPPRSVQPPRPVAPSKDAARLRAITKALQESREHIEQLSAPALSELPPALADFLGQADSWIAAVERSTLRFEARKRSGNPNEPDGYILTLVAECARIYESVTGKEPAISGSSRSKFAVFVEAVFGAGDLKESAEHYARRGAKVHRQRKMGAQTPAPGYVALLKTPPNT